VRLRLEGGVQCSLDPPSRRRLQRLLRMRPSETIGITARDTLSCHGRACPGHPGPEKLSASIHWDHRDKPGDDGRGGSRRVRRPNETAGGTKRRLSIGITGTRPRIKSGEVMTAEVSRGVPEGHPSRSPALNAFQDPQPLSCEVAQPPSRWTKECPESTGASFGTRPLPPPNEVGARGWIPGTRSGMTRCGLRPGWR
jgi:hypothetical protein